MLRTNLATRPFYNDRAVRIGLAALAVAAAVWTAYSGATVWRLRAQNAVVRERIAQDETEARDLRDKARLVRQSLDRARLDAVQAAAREANQLIERRAFSWTDLFNRFEATLPPDVRIASVQPQIDQDGRMLVVITVLSRRIEDLDGFIDALEKTGAFRGVLTRQEQAEDDGSLRSIVQGYYGPPPPEAATGQPAASEPETPAPGNQTPGNQTPGVVAEGPR